MVVPDMNLTIVFTRGDAWWSKVIMWFTRSKMSHVAIAYDDQTFGLRMTIGATEKGSIDRIPWDKFAGGTKIMAEFTTTGPPLNDALKQLILRYTGRPYDFGAAGAVGIKNRFRRIWSYLGVWLREKLTDPKKLICTELVVRLLGAGNYTALVGLDPELARARDIFDRFMTSKEEVDPIYVDPVLIGK